MNFNSLFYPRSVLLIGSSKKEHSTIMVKPEIFRRVYLNLHDFEGYGAVSDIEKMHKYPSTDLTIISLSPKDVISESKHLKTKFLIILS
ncbi:MAG: hypothetical protein KAS04_02465, partial [Candidatus Aenigmarchaeota archaeon]|nr:hypothetical protein [Candidatus Aenigmarchaeota archaeon]